MVKVLKFRRVKIIIETVARSRKAARKSVTESLRGSLLQWGWPSDFRKADKKHKGGKSWPF